MSVFVFLAIATTHWYDTTAGQIFLGSIGAGLVTSIGLGVRKLFRLGVAGIAAIIAWAHKMEQGVEAATTGMATFSEVLVGAEKTDLQPNPPLGLIPQMAITNQQMSEVLARGDRTDALVQRLDSMDDKLTLGNLRFDELEKGQKHIVIRVDGLVEQLHRASAANLAATQAVKEEVTGNGADTPSTGDAVRRIEAAVLPKS